MSSLSLRTKSEAETGRLGRELGKNLLPGDILALVGQLGAGKTVLARGIAAGMGVRRRDVKSPSYVIVNEYAGKFTLYHIDFYRIDKPEEIERLGWEEYVFSEGAAVIEWAEKIERLLGGDYLRIELNVSGEKERLITLNASGPRHLKLLREIKLVRGRNRIKN